MFVALVFYGLVCLSSGILKQEEKHIGRAKRLYPLGRYRLRVPKDAEADKAYSVVLEYTWNRQIIRKTTNVFAKIADWNQNGNQGLTSFCCPVSSGSTACLRSTTSGIRTRLQPKWWLAFLRTSHLPGGIRERISWNLRWNTSRQTIPGIGSAGAATKTGRAA